MAERKGQDGLAIIVACGSLAAGVALVCVLNWLGVKEQAVIVALLLLPLLVYGTVSGRISELTGPGGWGAKFAALETEIEKTKSRIEELFLLSMSEVAFSNLTKLHDGWTGDYWLDPDLRSGLATELNHFKLLGYIEFNWKEGVFGVGNVPKGNQQNLSRYIGLTDLGREYVRARREILAQKGQAAKA